MRDSHVFNLYGGYPFPARLDDIFAAVCDAHIAQGVHAGDISCAEPVVFIHCTRLRMLHTFNVQVVTLDNDAAVHDMLMLMLAVFTFL